VRHARRFRCRGVNEAPHNNAANMKLLERSTELDRLTALLRTASGGEGRLVFLGGEAGVGKTSLVREFCRSVPSPVRVLTGGCDPLSAPRPLGPLIDIASAVGGELERLLQTNGPRHEIFREFLPMLLAGNKPSVVVFEDVHWADDATLDLLRYLGRRIDAAPVLLIVTYRDDELGPRHPLRLVVGDLATAASVYRIALSPLSIDAVRALAEGSGLDPAALHSRTGGNPFFLTEVLTFSGHGTPPTVRDAVLARAARLSPVARETLEVAAVIGLRSESWLLAELSGTGIEDCISAGMLRVEPNALAFPHELSRNPILEVIAPDRQVLLHRRVLRGLQRNSGGFSDLARLAHHAEGAGDGEAVLAYAPAAAERAAAVRAHREAAAQYARALRFAGNLAPERRADLLERWSLECSVTDQLPEAVEATREALEIRRALGDRISVGDNLRLLSTLLFELGRRAEAEEACLAAVRVLDRIPPGPSLALSYSELCRLRTESGDFLKAVSWGEKALAVASQAGDRPSVIEATIILGDARVRAGDRKRGFALIERGLLEASEASIEQLVARGMQCLAIATLLTREQDRTERYVKQLLDYALEHDLPVWRAWGLSFMARTYFHQGRWTEASQTATAALRVQGAGKVPPIWALISLGHLRARQGDPEAAPVLDQAFQLAGSIGHYEPVMTLRGIRAEAAWLAGDHARTLEEAGGVYDRAVAAGDEWCIGELAFWMWRAGKPPALPARTAEPYALQMAGNWEAAAANWRARGRPYEEAQALADSGDVAVLRRALAQFERLGARPAAAFVARRLRALGAHDIPRGPRHATRAHPHKLTPREVEILSLVAKGFRNSDIADRLYLSPKTVDHHVSSILGKLGLRTRTAAAAEFARWSAAPDRERLLQR
jgi:DNA-binding CsgD family transcriptional regulator/tetratricopeptide (TPR) repeat protein